MFRYLNWEIARDEEEVLLSFHDGRKAGSPLLRLLRFGVAVDSGSLKRSSNSGGIMYRGFRTKVLKNNLLTFSSLLSTMLT